MYLSSISHHHRMQTRAEACNVRTFDANGDKQGTGRGLWALGAIGDTQKLKGLPWNRSIVIIIWWLQNALKIKSD